MTYLEISEKYNIPLTTIYSRVHALKIKGRNIGQKKKLTKKQIEQLLEYNPTAYLEKWRKKNHKRKLAVIEFYHKFGSANKVSKFFTSINRNVVLEIIREYNNTGYVVVESKMNHCSLEELNNE